MEVSDAELLHFVTENGIVNVREVLASYEMKKFAEYLGIGQTKARELLHDPGCNFTVKIGNRLYANKLLVDKWLFSISGNKRKKGY